MAGHAGVDPGRCVAETLATILAPPAGACARVVLRERPLSPFGRPSKLARATVGPEQVFEVPAQRISQPQPRRNETARGQECAGTRPGCSRTRYAARAEMIRRGRDRGGREVPGRAACESDCRRRAGGGGAARQTSGGEWGLRTGTNSSLEENGGRRRRTPVLPRGGPKKPKN